MLGINFNKKHDIRKFVTKERDAIDVENKRKWDGEIFNKLINSEFYKKSKVIFVFVSFRSEVDTHRFIKYALKDQKVVGIPKVISKEKGIEVFQIKCFEDLERGYYGILEPKEDAVKIDCEEMDLIVMPGLAFDKRGGRIGYGGGFYDRFIRNLNKNIPKISIAYDLQILDEVPMEELDVRIDGVITEKNIFYNSQTAEKN